MAIATSLVVHTTAVVAVPGTSVSPGIAVPDNCHTILVQNSTGDIAYIGNGTAGGALTAANAVEVPDASSPSLPIGTLSRRAGTANFIYDAVVPGTLSIHYFCGVEV